LKGGVVVADFLQVGGLILLVVAAWLVWFPLGVFVAGVVLLGAGVLMDPKARLRRR
jgi:hypothetical protein